MSKSESKSEPKSKSESQSETQSKSEPEDVSAAAMRFMLVVVSLKGGVGKSFIALLLAMILGYLGRGPTFVSIDRLHGAANLLDGVRVLTSDLPDESQMETDAYAVLKAFSIMRKALGADENADIAVDLGAPASRHLLRYWELSRMNATLAEAGIVPVFVLPYSMDPAAIDGALEIGQLLPGLVPNARIVTVENRRYFGSSAPMGTAGDRLTALRKLGHDVVVPPLPAAASRFLEHGVRLDAAVALPERRRAELLGETDDIAVIVNELLKDWLRDRAKTLREGLGL